MALVEQLLIAVNRAALHRCVLGLGIWLIKKGAQLSAPHSNVDRVWPPCPVAGSLHPHARTVAHALLLSLG